MRGGGLLSATVEALLLADEADQVIGYLVFENGIYLFGLAISYEIPWLIEMGVLLDVFVAVFVMGIVINHIALAFDSISTEKMTRLSD